MIVCDEQKCTGCFACMNICPSSAISVGTGYLDKTIPSIDAEKCVNCGLCKSVCPVLHPVKKRKAEYAFAAWSKNDEDIALSSSGGIASAFSRCVLKQDGIVFGSTNEGKKTHLISISNENEINKLRGSKYVQSDVNFSYRKIKDALKLGKKVLFISTPCQVAGLKNFLKHDYDDLITVDLICHGVPPQKYLAEHLNGILQGKLPNKIEFRGKYDFKLTVYGKCEHIIYQKNSSDDNYFCAFLDSMTFRDNCYVCSYSCTERCSDITIGDFWGLDKDTLENKYSGRVSLVLPNTEKGINFFEQCSNELVWEKRSLAEACNESQGNLLHPSIPSEDRTAFEKYYPLYGFEKTISKYTELGRNIRRHNSILLRTYRKFRRICSKIVNLVMK